MKRRKRRGNKRKKCGKDEETKGIGKWKLKKQKHT